MNRTQKILGSAIVSLLFIAMTMLPMCGVSLQRLDPGMEDITMMDETDGEYQDDLLSNLETLDGDGGFAESDGFSDADFAEANDNAASESFENQDLIGDASATNETADDSEWSDDGWGDDGWADDNWDDGSTSEEFQENSSEQIVDSFDDGFDSFDDASDSDTFVMTDANNTQQADEESWITPELMESLQKEIEDLEKIADHKNRTADSLRQVKREMPEKSSENIASTNGTITSDLDDSDFMDSASFDSEFADNNYSAAKTAYSTVAADGSNTAIEIAYDEARNSLIDRNYNTAISQFRIMLVGQNTGHLSDNCQYWIGEAYFAKGEYIKAIVEFEKVNAFPKSNKSLDAQLMLGIALLRIGENQQAEREFTDIITISPNNSAAQKASRYLTEIPRA